MSNARSFQLQRSSGSASSGLHLQLLREGGIPWLGVEREKIQGPGALCPSDKSCVQLLPPRPTASSPSFPRPLGSGMRCTWLLGSPAPSGTILSWSAKVVTVSAFHIPAFCWNTSSPVFFLFALPGLCIFIKSPLCICHWVSVRKRMSIHLQSTSFNIES